jgi:hypothetical protein
MTADEALRHPWLASMAVEMEEEGEDGVCVDAWRHEGVELPVRIRAA